MSVYRTWVVSESRRKLKIKAVEYLGGSCVRCGYDRCVDAMDFHHKNPAEKDFQVGGGSYRSWERVQVELDKCELLCSNCHREHHSKGRQEQQSKLKDLARQEVPARPTPIDTKCLVCSKPMRVIPSRHHTGMTCSVACYSAKQEVTEWPPDSELAKWVWVVPATHIAATLGVSSSAVKRRCRRRGIDTPGRGYWSQQAKVV